MATPAMSSNLLVLDRAERAATQGASAAIAILRELPLEDFGTLMWSLPNERYPNLSRCLPRMASEDVQRDWTGASGDALLRQTLAFVRMLDTRVNELGAKPLAQSRVLDFGCGYGRHLRLMYYFRNPSELFACDPWEASISVCQADGVLGNLARSEDLPADLPFGDVQFDVIYAFSVFTHLSPTAARMAFTALRNRIAADGLLFITVRPVEYWSYAEKRGMINDAQALERQHRETGFAFRPHNRPAVDGDITFGDTSMTAQFIRLTYPWDVVHEEQISEDPLQVLLALRPGR